MDSSELQVLIDQKSPGQSLILEPPHQEIKGTILLRQPIVLQGRGATIRNAIGPIITIESKGVLLRDLSLVITNDPFQCQHDQACALLNRSGQEIHPRDVTLRGNVIGIDREEGLWGIPYSVQLGSLAAEQEHSFQLNLNLPQPCQLSCNIDGVNIEPQVCHGGTTGLLLHVEALRPRIRIRGAIRIETPLFTREIIIGGNVAPRKSVKNIVGIGQRIFDWEHPQARSTCSTARTIQPVKDSKHVPDVVELPDSHPKVDNPPENQLPTPPEQTPAENKTRTDNPKTQTPKQDTPKQDTPKKEAPKKESPKKEAPARKPTDADAKQAEEHTTKHGKSTAKRPGKEDRHVVKSGTLPEKQPTNPSGVPESGLFAMTDETMTRTATHAAPQPPEQVSRPPEHDSSLLTAQPEHDPTGGASPQDSPPVMPRSGPDSAQDQTPDRGPVNEETPAQKGDREKGRGWVRPKAPVSELFQSPPPASGPGKKRPASDHGGKPVPPASSANQPEAPQVSTEAPEGAPPKKAKKNTLRPDNMGYFENSPQDD